jgi:nucleoside-diphosphate-sugar epimerase
MENICLRVLLTGATGFIGKYVYDRLLHKDIELHIISRHPQYFLKKSHVVDILNCQETKTLIKKIKPQVLIHLAWDVTHDEFWFSSKNSIYADATVNLFNVFLEQGGEKIISTGTCAEYPTSENSVSENIVFDESILTPYGRSKKKVSKWLQKTNCDFTWLRIFGIYGDGEDSRRLFPSMIRAIQSNQEFIIKNSNIFCDYVYVDDVANFIVDCLCNKTLGVVNIGTGENYAVLDLYHAITKYIKSGLFSIEKMIKKPDINSRIPSVQKLHEYGYRFNLNSRFFKNLLPKNCKETKNNE